MAFDPLQNIFTLPGLQALNTEATHDGVTNSPAPNAAQPALGGGTPPTADTADIVEPDPDYETGEGNLGLGKDLGMKIFDEPLFVGALSMHEPIQGFLGNCPLAAVLCAMAHVPAQRNRLRNEIIKEVAMPVASNRQRKPYEYFPTDLPSPIPMASPKGPFLSDRLLAVRFQRTFPVQALSTDIFEAGRLRKRLNAPKSVPVSSVLFVDLRFNEIHYMKSASGALWPSIIEKAYAVGRGQNTYQGLEGSIGLAEVMRDLTGSAEEEHLVNGPDDTLPEITDKKLKSWLSQHTQRPIILGSPPTATLVTGNHTFAVIGKTKTTVKVIDALESDPASREIEVPMANIRENFHEIVRGPI
ncbi:MAG: hypothetical protein AAF927_06630 [Bacteroidota bacterium]